MILNLSLFSICLFDWYHKMVSPQNGDTGVVCHRPPPTPYPPRDAIDLVLSLLAPCLHVIGEEQ